MRLAHDPMKTRASFEDPDLVSRAGLVPVMSLAERAGLEARVRRHVRIAAAAGVNADLKAGAWWPVLSARGQHRGHGRAPARRDGRGVRRGPGSVDAGIVPALLHLRERPPTGGCGPGLLAELARRAPLLPGAGVLAYVDIDSMQRRVYGHKKQGAAFGHTKIQGKTVLVRGLSALAATISTPLAAPVNAGTRLRGGSAASARGAASFAAEAVRPARPAAIRDGS